MRWLVAILAFAELAIGQKKMDQSLFQNVRLNSSERSACSPENPGPNWRGIRIQAPDSAVIRSGKKGAEFGTIPLCGLYTVNLADLLDDRPMMIIARDQRTGVTYRGEVVETGDGHDVPHPQGERKMTRERARNLAISSYFNRNVAEFVELPQWPATYEIHIEYGGLKSNTVVVRLANRL